MFGYEKEREEGLSGKEGEVMEVVERDVGEWTRVKNFGGDVGIYPTNRLKFGSPPPASRLPPPQ
jgi:hypothetical protein